MLKSFNLAEAEHQKISDITFRLFPVVFPRYSRRRCEDVPAKSSIFAAETNKAINDSCHKRKEDLFSTDT
jgi:hypothetical protein